MAPGDNQHGDCLSDETLTDYLEGALDPVVHAACEAHLIACDPCRQQLALFMRVLQPQVTPAEEIAVQGIAASWNKRHARQAPVHKALLTKRTAWYVGAAAALLLLILGPARTMLHWIDSTESARELVQAMLAKDRPFPTQLADQPYNPMPRTTETSPRMDYESLSSEMSKRAASQYDLGRFELIRKQFPKAIAALEDAAKDPKATAAVHNDLGVAYMEQGVAETMTKAEAEFNEALRLNPRFAPAIFNLALFYDRTNLPDKAQQERKLYLQVDSTSNWADEVRVKLTP